MEPTTGNVHKTPSPNKSEAPLVEVTRTFTAPIEKVWEVWTKPELAKQWWGPENYSCPEAHIDFREDGKYLLAMQGPDGAINWSGGKFKEIIPLEKIVYTDSFTDKNGHPVSAKSLGMPGNWPEKMTITVEFEKTGRGETRMHLAHQGIPKEMHDDCVNGWSSSIDKMQKLVEKN